MLYHFKTDGLTVYADDVDGNLTFFGPKPGAWLDCEDAVNTRDYR